MAIGFSRVLAALAGGRADVLSVVDGARGKFAAMGAVLLATAGIAALSAGFAMRMALEASLPVAVAVGVGWGLVILAVDRALMAGMANQRSWARSLAVAAPRVVLALILGTVISTPVTLQIFHKETDTEIRAIQREAADDFAAQLKGDTRFVVIPELERQVAEAKSRVVSEGGTDPAVKDKQAIYDAAFAKYQELQAAAQCELNGNCGTGRVGFGGAYDEAKAAADRQLTVVNSAKRDLDSAAAASSAQASTDLQRAENELAELKRTREGLQADFDARNGDNSGLLIRLEALERMGTNHSLLGWAHALLWAMFTCIELLPVLVKLLMNIGVQSAYDRVQAAWDGSAADVFDDQTQAWRDAQSARSQLAVDEAEKDRDIARAALQKDKDIAHDRLDREKAQQIGINARAFAVETRVVEGYLDVYEQQVLQQAQDRIEEFKHRQAHNGVGPGAYIHPAPNGHGTNGYMQTAQLPDGTVL